jgi:ABC-2 type transport system permease protein
MLAAPRRELRELAGDARMRWALALVAGLACVIALVDADRAARIHADHAAADRASYEHWLDQGAKNPHSAAHFGIYCARPVGQAAFLVPGVSEFTGNTIWVEAHKQNASRLRDPEDATRVTRLPAFSAAFALELIAPLLAMLLGFALVAQDREHGRLRMLLAQGVPPGTVIAGKALALLAALLVAMVPLALIAILGVPGERSVGRLFGLGAVYGLYLATFAQIALGVSARARTAGAALGWLRGFWVLACVLAPRLALSAAEVIVPTPSSAALKAAIAAERQATLDRLFPERGVSVFEEETLKQHDVAHRDLLPFSFRAAALQRDEDEGNDTFDRHIGGLWSAERRQERATLALGWSSPLVPARLAAMAFAGSDVQHDRDFARAVETYRRGVQRAMNDDLKVEGRGREYTYVADRNLWSRVEPFRYAPPPASAVWSAQAPALGVLGLWLAGAIAFVAIAVRRLAVR